MKRILLFLFIVTSGVVYGQGVEKAAITDSRFVSLLLPNFKDMANLQNIYSGKTINYLTILADEIPIDKEHPRISVRCLCKCGTIKIIRLSYIVEERTKSCGCLRIANRIKHSLSITHKTEFRTWVAMLHRCNSPKDDSYKRYGGRGITVCERWNNPANFIEDMGLRPKGKYSLDRINNDLGYCKENCRWALKEVQSNNTSTNRFLELNGIRLTVTQWARRIGMKRITLSRRVNAGWSIPDAINTPASNKKHFV